MSVKCVVGKHCCYGSDQTANPAQVFTNKSSISLDLCYKHDIELFKLGQLKFWVKYAEALEGSVEAFGIKATKKDYSVAET
jgi:hypothetical protein